MSWRAFLLARGFRPMPGIVTLGDWRYRRGPLRIAEIPSDGFGNGQRIIGVRVLYAGPEGLAATDVFHRADFASAVARLHPSIAA